MGKINMHGWKSWKKSCNFKGPRRNPYVVDKFLVKLAETLGNNNILWADQKSQWAWSCKNRISVQWCVLMKKILENSTALRTVHVFMSIVNHTIIIVLNECIMMRAFRGFKTTFSMVQGGLKLNKIKTGRDKTLSHRNSIVTICK